MPKISCSACSLGDLARGLKLLELQLIPSSGPYFKPCPGHRSSAAPGKNALAWYLPGALRITRSLLSGKTSLCHKPQRHFLKDLLKVRLQFKRTPASALVLNKTSLLPSGSTAYAGRPWLYFGWGQGLVQPPPITRYAGESKSSAPTKF